MNQQQVIEFICRQLDDERSCEEVTRLLCEQTGWPRQQVELFVRKVELDHQKRAAELVASPRPQPIQQPGTIEPRVKSAGPVEPPSPAHSRRRIALEEHGEAVEFVIRELGSHREHDEIIRALCERHEWAWKQARHFVQRVEVEHYDKIVARQSPLVILLGVGIIAGGLLLSAYMAFLTLNGEVINLSGLPVPYLENVAYFFTGLGMIVGGIAGIWRAINQLRG